VERAIAAARQRLLQHPLVTVVIRRSHHIGCLQAYLQPVTDEGLIILLLRSLDRWRDALRRTRLPPHPEPDRRGISDQSGPGAHRRQHVHDQQCHGAATVRGGWTLPRPWLVDADGRPHDDPAALFGERPGAVLPLGGFDLGHKGFAMALLVEALTSGLAGHGRADEPQEWGASVFLQLLDPDRFAGRAAFERQTSWLAELCRTTPVAAGRPRVRLPGEAALARRMQQLQDGVALYPAVLPALAPWAERLRVPLPTPIPTGP
jgi:LDH2 family malate/lactate/ureidoglycolate dehydrogenase